MCGYYNCCCLVGGFGFVCLCLGDGCVDLFDVSSLAFCLLVCLVLFGCCLVVCLFCCWFGFAVYCCLLFVGLVVMVWFVGLWQVLVGGLSGEVVCWCCVWYCASLFRFFAYYYNCRFEVFCWLVVCCGCIMRFGLLFWGLGFGLLFCGLGLGVFCFCLVLGLFVVVLFVVVVVCCVGYCILVGCWVGCFGFVFCWVF